MFYISGLTDPLKRPNLLSVKLAWTCLGNLLSWKVYAAAGLAVGLGTGQSWGHRTKIKCQPLGLGLGP